MSRLKRRHAAALAFTATCGFLAGLAVMAIATLISGRTPYVPAAIARPSAPVMESAPARAPVALAPSDARAAVHVAPAPAAVAAVPDATLADAPAPAPDPPDVGEAVEDLRRRQLQLPIAVDRSTLRSSFDEARGGSRRHEAMDLLAPRHTPVVAVESGIIARLFDSKAGGLTIYQFDPTTTYAYYYAHLQRYADGLEEGATVARGQTIGYVGTSGNAPENTPHLHFAIFVLTDDKRWWQGSPIDPFDVLR
jgi:peptidoglycan LD-endopeptidase LytH